MIYIQNGPSWKPKVDKILEQKLANGIIWDPREESLERIQEIRSSNSMYDNVENLIDLKWYYKEFSNSIMKRLEGLEYFPDEIINRNFLRDTNKISEYIDKMIKFQEKNNMNIFLTPALYIYSFNDRNVDKLFDILDIYAEKCQKPKYISLMFHESAFESISYMNDFINDFSMYQNSYEGVYLVIDRDNSSNIRNFFSSDRLSRVMQFIYYIKKLGMKVIVGYSGIESINYMAAGADAIATGWFYSLRKFNKLEKGLEEYSTMGRAKKRYTSINFLNELTLDEHIKMIPEGEKSKIYPIIFNGNVIDEKIIKGNYDIIPINDTYIQYFEAMNVLSKKFKDGGIEQRIETLEKLIDNAIENTNKYMKIKEKNPAMEPISKKHLEGYKKAIELFKEENFI